MKDSQHTTAAGDVLAPQPRMTAYQDDAFRLYIVNDQLLVIVPPHDAGREDAERFVKEWRDRHGLSTVRWVVMPQGTTVTDLRQSRDDEAVPA